MPLLAGTSKEIIQKNIQELIKSGKKPSQAAGIAHRKARNEKKNASLEMYARGSITAKRIGVRIAEKKPDYMIEVNGKRWGRILSIGGKHIAEFGVPHIDLGTKKLVQLGFGFMSLGKYLGEVKIVNNKVAKGEAKSLNFNKSSLRRLSPQVFNDYISTSGGFPKENDKYNLKKINPSRKAALKKYLEAQFIAKYGSVEKALKYNKLGIGETIFVRTAQGNTPTTVTELDRVGGIVTLVRQDNKKELKIPIEILEFSGENYALPDLQTQLRLMLSNPPRITKIRNRGRSGKTSWNIEVYSPSIRKYITQGEWPSESKAKKDLISWKKAHIDTLNKIRKAMRK